jgi:uncharacterized protein
MTGSRLLAWAGPDPERIDVAHVVLGPDRLAAHGSSTTPEFALTYWLVTGPGWVTQRLDVRIDGDGWWRGLSVGRTDDGRWSSQHTDTTTAGTSATRTVEHPELSRALDCDLGLCPLTNTMPVLREDLIGASRRGEHRPVELPMAFVGVPELDVALAVQRYDPGVVVAGGGAQIRFQADTFVEHIEVDAD